MGIPYFGRSLRFWALRRRADLPVFAQEEIAREAHFYLLGHLERMVRKCSAEVRAEESARPSHEREFKVLRQVPEASLEVRDPRPRDTRELVAASLARSLAPCAEPCAGNGGAGVRLRVGPAQLGCRQPAPHLCVRGGPARGLGCSRCPPHPVGSCVGAAAMSLTHSSPAGPPRGPRSQQGAVHSGREDAAKGNAGCVVPWASCRRSNNMPNGQRSILERWTTCPWMLRTTSL